MSLIKYIKRKLEERHEIAYNKELIKKYPFLLPFPYGRDDDGFFIGLDEGEYFDEEYDYSYTILDEMPIGWRKAFGEMMCDEIAEELKRCDYLYDYTVIQIKEKYGTLRWYDNGVPVGCKVQEIIDKYEKVSEGLCIMCGKSASWITSGWVSPYCNDCVDKMHLKNCIPIGEFYE